MKRKHANPRELPFLAAAFLVAGLAFRDAAPLHPAADRAAVRASGSLLDAAQVDLNTAGLEALCTLPGIGESKARAIIEDRAANGPYAQAEDVTRVSGITRNTIKDWVRLAYVS